MSSSYSHQSLLHYIHSKKNNAPSKYTFETCLSPTVTKLFSPRPLNPSLVSKKVPFDKFDNIDSCVEHIFNNLSLYRSVYEEYDKKDVLEYIESFGIDIKQILNIQNDFLLFCVISTILEKVFLVYIGEKKVRKLSECLSHKKIVSLVGTNYVVFLESFIGSPKGINLRNTIWHGFINHHKEFKGDFTKLLLVLFFDICMKIKEKVGDMFKIRFSEKEFVGICGKGFNVTYNDIESLIENSYFIIPDRIEFIKTDIIKNQYFKHNYYSFLVLLLPQLEHCLRRIFIVSNEIDQRLLLAQTREFYTTLDIILSNHLVSNKKNNMIVGEIGEDVFNKLKDLFIYNEGLRIRDMIAHCTARPYSITKEIADEVLICFIDLLKNVSFKKYEVPQYIPLYHPKSLLLKEMNEAFVELRKFQKDFVSVDESDELVKRLISENEKYKCLFSKKRFVYSKNDVNNPKETFYSVDDINEKLLLDIKNEEKYDIYFQKDAIESPIKYYLCSFKDSRIEDFSLDYEKRNSLIINIKISRNIVKKVKMLFKILQDHFTEIYTTIKNRKGRTKHRKHFGVFYKMKDMLKNILLLLLLINEKEILHNFSETNEKVFETSNHLLNQKVLIVLERMIKFNNAGKLGSSVQLFFNKFF